MKGDGVEIKVKGEPFGKTQFRHGVEPKTHPPRIALGIYPATVFGEKRAFGDHIQTGKERQPFVQHVTHDVAVAGGAKKLQRQKRTEGMAGGDHL